MTDRRLQAPVERPDPPAEGSLRHRHTPPTRMAELRLRHAMTSEEVEAAYEAARVEWTAAMRAARSGKPADMAALAIAQEAYENALAEKRRWEAGPRVAIPIESERPRGIDAIVDQELARRRVKELEEQHRQEKRGGLGGLLRRLRGG
jgi:hypothetical protein